MGEITLRSTEVIGGKKLRPGDRIDLPEDHPVAVKTRQAEAAERAASAAGGPVIARAKPKG